MGFFLHSDIRIIFSEELFLRMGSACVCVRERSAPSTTWIGTCSQPAMQLSLRNALLAPTDAVCLREAHLPRIRSQRSALGIHGVEMKVEPDTKKGHPNKIAKKNSKASGNLRVMPILVISNGWITTKEAGESVKRKIRMVRSLTFSGDVPPASGHG